MYNRKFNLIEFNWIELKRIRRKQREREGEAEIRLDKMRW